MLKNSTVLNACTERRICMDEKYYYLTTIDNPYNPATQFDEWLAYDTQKGYNSCGYLSRAIESKTSDFSSMTQLEQSSLIRTTIQEIVKENILGLYMFVAI